MGSSRKVNWEDEISQVLLNPRLPENEAAQLIELEKQYRRKSHLWMASSGSSKNSQDSVKLIALSKSAFLASAQAVNAHLKSSRDDCWVQVLPNFHVGGRSIEARCFLSGARVVDGFLNEKWDAHHFHKVVSEKNGTLSALVPTQVVDLIRAGLRCPSSMRAIVIGGSALSLEIYQQALDLGWPLLPSYGMTECCSQVATASLESLKTRKPELELLSHIHAQKNSEGFLRIQSSALLTGYAQWRSGESSWTDPRHEGWFQTEDLCEIDGLVLTPLGRGSDFVKISGEGVSLQKLQEILESLALQKKSPDWKELALIALPDARTQFQICLVSGSVQFAPDFLADLTVEFNLRVAPYERIQLQKSVASIPRTALGKIARGALKDLIS
jgi:O-succinylbenzoic acid--CoA ligase